MPTSAKEVEQNQRLHGSDRLCNIIFLAQRGMRANERVFASMCAQSHQKEVRFLNNDHCLGMTATAEGICDLCVSSPS